MLTSTSHERKLQETQVVHHFHRGTGVDRTHCIEGKAEKLLGRRDTQTWDCILERTTEKSDTPAVFTVNNRCRLDRLASPDITQLSHRLDGKELRCKAHTETHGCTKTVVSISFFCSPKQLLVVSHDTNTKTMLDPAAL
jgi:hypothetical protein